MEVLHHRCAGLDISKRDAKVCIRVPGPRRNTFTKLVTVSGSVTRNVMELRDYSVAEDVTLVVMEATGDYWKPFYYLLDPVLNVMLVNARHARNLPGRKTDVSDAQWLAELGAHGLVRASFVPPEHIRQLRDLTRSRTIFVAEKSREIQRIEKLLEDANIRFHRLPPALSAFPAGPYSKHSSPVNAIPPHSQTWHEGAIKTRPGNSHWPSMAGSMTIIPTP